MYIFKVRYMISYTLIIRVSVDVILWKPLCFLAYGFLTLYLFHAWFRFVFSARMSSHWLVKQLFNCFIHYLLEFSYEFQLISSSVDFWWIFFIFWLFLITCMILRWLFCHLLLLYFFSMIVWPSCHFTSLQWQVSQDLLPCVQWSFLHPSFFHYSACNVPDTLCTWCLSSRLSYCPCITAWCGHFPSKFPYCPHIASWCGSFPSVKFSRFPSDCWDSTQSKINPLLLLWLHSDHPPRLQHYDNQNPKLRVPPEPSDTLLLLSKLQTTLENPNHISVFICLHHSALVLLNSKPIFMSSSQFSPFHFRYIKPFQYSHSLILASALPSYISASLLLNSSNSL